MFQRRSIFTPNLENLMKSMKAAAVACLLAVGLLSAGAAEARAETYGVVTITNPTSGPINYTIQWGSERAVHYYLAAGESRMHYHALDAYNRAPAPRITFDNGVGNVMRYNLEFYAANRVNYYSGKKYDFARSGPYLDLYAK
jgi:hypothetical protein